MLCRSRIVLACIVDVLSSFNIDPKRLKFHVFALPFQPF
jgi:hypothetical protein